MGAAKSQPRLSVPAVSNPPALTALLLGMGVVALGLFVRMPYQLGLPAGLLLSFMVLPRVLSPRRRPRAAMELRFLPDHLELVGRGVCHRVPWSSVRRIHEAMFGMVVEGPLPVPLRFAPPTSPKERRELRQAVPSSVPLELKPPSPLPLALLATWALVIAAGAAVWTLELGQ